MKEIKDALLRMVRAGRSTKEMCDCFVQAGLDDNKLFEIYGEIADAIYGLLGERTQTYEESVTYIALTTPILTDERRAEMLYSEWKKNHASQPAPNTIEPDEMQKMTEENGGYMAPEGDRQ